MLNHVFPQAPRMKSHSVSPPESHSVLPFRIKFRITFPHMRSAIPYHLPAYAILYYLPAMRFRITFPRMRFRINRIPHYIPAQSHRLRDTESHMRLFPQVIRNRIRDYSRLRDSVSIAYVIPYHLPGSRMGAPYGTPELGDNRKSVVYLYAVDKSTSQKCVVVPRRALI